MCLSVVTAMLCEAVIKPVRFQKIGLTCKTFVGNIRYRIVKISNFCLECFCGIVICFNKIKFNIA